MTPPEPLIAALAVAGLALATGCGSDSSNHTPAQPPPEAARLEFVAPASVSVPPTVAIELDGRPGQIVTADEGVWVAVYGGHGGDRVVRIDPATNRVVASVPVRGSPFQIAAGEGSVWVTGNSAEGGDVLHRIDPATNRVVATTSFPRDSTGAIAAGEGAAWLVRSGSLARIDLETNEVTVAIPLEAGQRRHNFDELRISRGAVWVLALEGLDHPGDVIRLDPETNKVVANIRAEALNTGVGPGGLWITGCVDCDEYRDTFFAQEIDTDANASVGPRLAVDKLGFGPLYVGEDSVWFSGYGERGSRDRRPPQWFA
jgi:YVTN family beta-propeller protein